MPSKLQYETVSPSMQTSKANKIVSWSSDIR